jgi:D-sedoheptulose 7-phosphate isomerase
MSGFSPNNLLRQQGDINFFVPSHSYGEVEITHLTICHAIVDAIIEEREITSGASPTSVSRPA